MPLDVLTEVKPPECGILLMCAEATPEGSQASGDEEEEGAGGPNQVKYPLAELVCLRWPFSVSSIQVPCPAEPLDVAYLCH